MTLDELAGLLQASRFLAFGGSVEREALRAVPELADGLPAVVFDARGPHVWSGASDALKAPLAGLGAALASEARLPPSADAERRLAEDPLVVVLARLIVEGARHSPGAAVVPLLEVARGSVAAQAEPALAALHQGAPDAGGEALRRVAAGVQARLSAACARASETVRVPALAWAIARSRLLPLYGRGSLDRATTWPRVAAVLDVPLPPGTVEMLEVAVTLAVRGVAERRAAGKSTADDATLILRALGPARLDAGVDTAAAALLLDPDGLAALLPTLSRFVDVAALQKAKVDPARAAALLTPAGGLAVASVMLEVLAALRSWDILSRIADVVVAPPQRAFVVPRGGPARGAVVAVGLGRLRSEAGSTEAAEAGWEDLVRTADGAVVGDVGGAGVAVFVDAVDGLRFAIAARRRLPGAPVSFTFGAITGGTDGGTTRLGGPAVEAAKRWIAGAPVQNRGASDDSPVRLRQVGGWLCGDGLAIDAAGESAVQEARVRRGLATAADGPAGGDPRGLRSLDVLRVFEFDGGVLAVVRIPGVAGGYEALHLTTAEWRDMLDREGERTEPPLTQNPMPMADSVAPPVQAVSAGVDPNSGEEAGGWELAEADEGSEEVPVTLNLDEQSFEGPGAFPVQPRFEFDVDDGEGAMAEELLPFSGFYLPGAGDDGRGEVGRPPETRAPPPAMAFEMSVEDDEEDTQDWGAPAPAPAPIPARAAPPRIEDVMTDSPVTIRGGDPFAGFTGFDEFPVPDDLRDPTTPHGAVTDAFTFSGTDPFVSRPGPDPFTTPSSSGPEFSFGGDPFADMVEEPTREIPLPARVEGPGVATGEPAGERHRGGVGPSGAMSMDFDYLLKGYACFFERKEAVFGRPYGTRIVDRHVYPYRGDPDEVYAAFMRDKISEGFVPRADMIGDLPRGVTVMPLDLEAMQRAWKELS